MIATLGISKKFALVIMGVFVASFAGTTLDTATRIQRYVIAELFGGFKLNVLTNRYVATAVAIGSALWAGQTSITISRHGYCGQIVDISNTYEELSRELRTMAHALDLSRVSI